MPSLSEKEIQEAAGKYFPLAVSLAKIQQSRLPPEVNEVKDLIGAASLGLVKGLRTYDPSSGTNLTGWLRYHMKFAMFDYLRRLDPLPQKARERVDRYEGARARLEQRLGRTPTRNEMGEELGWSLDEVEEIRWLAGIREESLEADDNAEDTLPPAEPWGYGGPETVTGWEDCWETLTEDEKVAVQMHADGATLEEIANIIGKPLSTLGRKLDSARRKLTECLSP